MIPVGITHTLFPMDCDYPAIIAYALSYCTLKLKDIVMMKILQCVTSKSTFVKRNTKQAVVIASKGGISIASPIESETTVRFWNKILQIAVTFIHQVKTQV